MNNFVLVHIGDSVPRHLKACIQQILNTNKNADIILASNLNIRAPSVHCININKLSYKETGGYFQSNSDPLWITSLKRIFILDSIIQKFNLKNTIHFDNDVLVFHDISEIKHLLSAPLYMTPHKLTEFTFGFCYAKETSSLSSLSEEIYKLILLGESKVKELTKDETHEMRLLGYANNNHITSLPVHPSINEPINNFIFDPSSYGQFIGGTPNGHSPGFIDDMQLAGSCFKLYPPTIRFVDRKPILDFNSNSYKIFNLHVHSKQLDKYVT
jgi:hypothetical protein